MRPSVVQLRFSLHRRTGAASASASASRRAALLLPPPLLSLPALRTPLRHQRSIDGRPRSSQWREKVQAHERLQREQRAAADAHARRAGQRQGRRGKSRPQDDLHRGPHPQEGEEEAGRTGGGTTAAWRSRRPGADLDARHDAAHSNPQAVPRFSLIQSLFTRRWFGAGGSGRGVKDMPLNPLHRLKGATPLEEKHSSNPDAAHVSRFLLAIEELYGRSRRRGEQVTAQLSDEEKRVIAGRYAETKWWGRFYTPFRMVPDTTVRRYLRIGRFVMMLCLLGGVAMALLLYREEMKVIGALAPDDRRDYTHMVMGMRMGEFAEVADAVLAKEDPLQALSPAARCRIVVEEGRRRGWHRVDWDVETPRRHPDSPLLEGDYIHLLYWASMFLGNIVFGGGAAVFNDQVFRVEETEREREHREPAQPLEPTAKPATTRRSFFS